MGMTAKMRAIKEVDGDEVDVKATERGMLHNLPYKVVWTAKGYGWQAMATSAIAALVVRPSTTAAATLFNNSTDKNYVIERVMTHQLVSAAAESRFGIWLCVHPVGMTAPTNDITVRNNTRGLTAGTEGIFDNGATVVDDGWFPWGESRDVEPTGVLPGAQVCAEINGRIILPPTSAISAHIVASSVNEDFTIGFHWFAVPISEFKMG
jgi:hypothetical protein